MRIDLVLYLDSEIFIEFENYCMERNKNVSEMLNLMITEKMMEQRKKENE